MQIRPVAALLSLLLLSACEKSAPEIQGAEALPRALEEGARELSPPLLATTSAANSAAIGKAAPEFTLTDTEGKVFRLQDFRGKTVVLEWFNPDCPFVKFARGKGPLVDLTKYGPELVWLSINSNAQGKQGHGRERNTEAKKEYAMSNPVLLDETGAVGRAYGALKTPHMFVIDPEGVLVYRGGLDNAPMGSIDDERPRPEGSKPGELAPYIENALSDLSGKRAIGMPDTPAYGCSVKYAD